jgi:hypothetical protein
MKEWKIWYRKWRSKRKSSGIKWKGLLKIKSIFKEKSKPLPDKSRRKWKKYYQSKNNA